MCAWDAPIAASASPQHRTDAGIASCIPAVVQRILTAAAERTDGTDGTGTKTETNAKQNTTNTLAEYANKHGK